MAKRYVIKRNEFYLKKGDELRLSPKKDEARKFPSKKQAEAHLEALAQNEGAQKIAKYLSVDSI